MKVGIVINHSYRGFEKPARLIAAELERLGAETEILTNMDVLAGRDAPDFKKCVFLDKDVICGTRLELAGVRLYNNIGAVEACDDKRMTYELLKDDFTVPETISFPLTFNETDIESFKFGIAGRLGFPLVAKEAFGSLGMQVRLISDTDELDSYMREHLYIPHLYQKYISSSRGRDVRVYVAGGEAVAAMTRRSRSDFRSNSSLGSEAEKFILNAELSETAVNIASMLGLDFCGIDFLYGRDGGFIVCEVNSNAMFETLSRISGVNIAEKIARRVLDDDGFEKDIINLI